ncbi:hypothetical protein PRK78_005152 [Emydomyces testavorans]|uniref:Uncharacterized protein n=1 Tax=Emydomyces testavorans TaxID=2070801 RepID=A0AAF0DJS1_9EURO|nr:hypothetical protein PRK78_005152 [Emydomyces testavorans]
MPPLPGEERLLTVFVDVHYYFTPPSPRPLLHRFDKGSYLYVHHDAAHHKTRIEIANNPGLPEQDAFAGSLETVLLRNSDKFPTLFTLTVNAQRQSVSGELPGQVVDNDWLLATGHPQDTSGALHKLHTLDLYFWTLEDARLFLATVQRVLANSQIDIIAAQTPAQATPVSAVVQQLEQVAILDPGYHNTHPTGASTTESTQLPAPPPGGPPIQSSTVQAPPASQPSMGHRRPLEGSEKSLPVKPQEQQVENYAPLAYNPAAPAAPEPIKHREKTPPPPDAAAGTGLAAAAARDQGASFVPISPPPGSIGWVQGTHHHMPGYHQSSEGQALYTSPPPTAGLAQPTTTSPPPPQSAKLSFGPTAGPPVTSGPPSASLTYPPQPPPQEPNVGVYRHQSFGSPPVSPAYSQTQQVQAQSIPGAYGQHQQYLPQSPQPQAPMGGYSDYSYGQFQQPVSNVYDIHNQVYRPTEAEVMSHKSHRSFPAGEKKPGKITENAMRVEKGVNRFLKKLEKKL